MDVPLAIYFVYAVLALAGAFIAIGIYSLFARARRTCFAASMVLLLSIIMLGTYLFASGYDATVLNLIHIYPFSTFFIIIFAIAMMLVNLLSYSNAKDYPDLLILLSLAFTSMLVVAASTSVISIFIGIELLAITTSFMILMEGRHRIEAAVKFFLLSSVSIAIFAFALALLLPYNTQLTLTAASQNPNLTGTYVITLALMMFIAAFGFDTALFPFNFWIPDVYEGSPSHITALLAGINKKVAFVALIEIVFIVFIAYKAVFSPAFMVLSILTMFFGNLIALAQKSVKRMFAYSSISQAGYILIGLASATQYGLGASIFYIIAHSFMIIGAFAIVMWLESKNIKTLEDYTALNSRNMFAAAALSIIMLSMAGIPPLIGFAGKFLLFSSAIGANMVALAVIGIINSFISIYYYGRVINLMYSRKSEKALSINPYVALVVIVSLAIIIAFGIYPQPIIAVASKAATSLLGA